MSDIRMKGPETRAALEEYLEEVDGPDAVPSEYMPEADINAARKEIAWLRKEVADLRQRVTMIQAQDDRPRDGNDDRPWARLAFTIAATFVFGKLVRRLHLGAAGAAAVPVISAQLSRRLL